MNPLQVEVQRRDRTQRGCIAGFDPGHKLRTVPDREMDVGPLTQRLDKMDDALKRVPRDASCSSSVAGGFWARPKADCLGPDAEDHPASCAIGQHGGGPARHRQPLRYESEAYPAVCPKDRPFEKIHRRRAEKTGDEAGSRMLVHVQGTPGLLHAALVEHGDPAAKGHRLLLVVSHVNRRDSLA